jgi:hypothetical protein
MPLHGHFFSHIQSVIQHHDLALHLRDIRNQTKWTIKVESGDLIKSQCHYEGIDRVLPVVFQDIMTC